jgi:hypothetical protein
MKTKVDINPFIEKLMNGSPEDKKLLDKIIEGKPFNVGNRRYRVISK